MYVESAQNPRVKAWSQLKTKKGRQTTGLFLVEGVRLVEEVLQSNIQVEAVLWDVSTEEPSEAFRASLRQRSVSFIELAPPAFVAISDTVTPQGVLAVARIPGPTSVPSLATLPGTVVAFDGVQDPGNLGTLLRSADAFGVRLVCCGTGTVDPYAPKVVRASMGGLFRLSVVTEPTPRFIERWRTSHPAGQVVSTGAESVLACYEVDFQKPTLLLIGSEASGVSEEAGSQADVQVRIPMEGHAESLNAAMAGSILLYETYRQRLE